MRTKPAYRTPPTFRDFEDYRFASAYTKGWNDAMNYIFPEEAERRERESMRRIIFVLQKDGEQDE